MKFHVTQMTARDAIAKALEQFDQGPYIQDPKKLYQDVPVDLVAVDSSSVPEQYAADKLVDIRLGELLGLGVMGAYYQHLEGRGYNVILGIDKSNKVNIESLLSDGAIAPFGVKYRMIFQQVSAQDLHGRDKNIEDEIIRNISNKESKRSSYPSICALLVNVYGTKKGFSLEKIITGCSMRHFDAYFCVVYHLPAINTCTVYYIDPDVDPKLIVESGVSFTLERPS